MSIKLPEGIQQDLEKACALHERAVSDYEKCREYSELMSSILARLEDGGYYDMADKVMGILLDCSPKTGAHCDKSTVVGQRGLKLLKIPR
jgi:hypothetical protein